MALDPCHVANGLTCHELKDLLLWGHWNSEAACWVTYGQWVGSDLNGIQGTEVRYNMLQSWMIWHKDDIDTWMRNGQYFPFPGNKLFLEACARSKMLYDKDYEGRRTRIRVDPHCGYDAGWAWRNQAFAPGGWWDQLQALLAITGGSLTTGC